jgi:hypothetical protein
LSNHLQSIESKLRLFFNKWMTAVVLDISEAILALRDFNIRYSVNLITVVFIILVQIVALRLWNRPGKTTQSFFENFHTIFLGDGQQV